MSIKEKTTKVLNGQIAKIKTSTVALMALIHETACETLLHASKHGDVTLCQRLYEAIGTDKGGVRAAELKVWFSAMGPITSRDDTWKLKDGWKPEDFNLELAESKPWYEWAGKGRFIPFSLTRAFDMILALEDRINKAVEEDRYQGDSKRDLKVLKGVIDFEAVKKAKEARESKAAEVVAETEKELGTPPQSTLIKKNRKAAKKAA